MTSPPGRIVTRLLVIAALAAPLAGCTDDGDAITLPSPSPTLSSPASSAEPSPSPSPSDPFAVPDEITADYAERVLNEIQRLKAGITKDILRDPVDEDAVELAADYQRRLEAIYGEPILTINTRGALDLLRSAQQRDDLVPADEFGQLLMSVEEVLADKPCIIARVDRDFSEVDAEDDAEKSTLAFTVLARAPESNPTGWQLVSLITSDAQRGSADEQELRNLTANDLAAEIPEVCS